ncbi:Uncharacterized protein FWK35_00037516, partial [Aphis craccivora]
RLDREEERKRNHSDNPTISATDNDILMSLKIAISKKLPREDYRELLDLSIIYLGGVPPGGIKFRKPGAYHMARWIAKAIY